MQGAWAIESTVQLSSAHFEVNVVYKRVELKRALPVLPGRSQVVRGARGPGTVAEVLTCSSPALVW